MVAATAATAATGLHGEHPRQNAVAFVRHEGLPQFIIHPSPPAAPGDSTLHEVADTVKVAAPDAALTLRDLLVLGAESGASSCWHAAIAADWLLYMYGCVGPVRVSASQES